MCGNPIEGHSFYDNHIPMSVYDYYSQPNLYQRLTTHRMIVIDTTPLRDGEYNSYLWTGRGYNYDQR